jgi:hypothetical protein
MRKSKSKFNKEINAEEEIKIIQKRLKNNIRSLSKKEEDPRNIFKNFNVDDLDRLIDFEGNEDD